LVQSCALAAPAAPNNATEQHHTNALRIVVPPRFDIFRFAFRVALASVSY